jgi:hypothetical protein
VGTWGAGPFSNDSAKDFVADVRDGVVSKIESFVAEPQIDDGFDEAFAALALLNAIVVASDCYLPPPEDVERWRAAFLTCFDEQVDSLSPDAKYKRDHRLALVAALDQLTKLSTDFHAS